MSTKQSNNEEVDLGSLFQIIGKGFSRLLNFIVSIFKGLFHVLILSLLFLRKHAIKIVIVGVAFGVIGYIIDFDRGTIYESKMLVKPNFESTKQLYGNIEFYNDLILQKEYDALVKIFTISDEEAKSLKNISIQAVINENNIINGYNKLVLSVDTLAIKNYTIKEFKEAFTEYDYEVHEIKIKSTKNNIFTKFDDIILSSVTSNTFFKNLKESEKVNLERSYNLYQKNLKDADTLRKVYMKALLDEAKKPAQGTSIEMGRSGQNKNKEIELFKTSRDLNTSLNNVNVLRAEKSEIINVISSFQEIGNKSEKIRDSIPFLFFVLGVFIAVLLLLLKELNTFLNNYKRVT